MIKPKKIIVVGGNAAGPAAAAKAKRFNPEAEVILFEAGSFISTGTCEMPYVLSGEIDDYKKIIFFSPEQFCTEKGVMVFVNHKVESINRKDKKVIVKDIRKGCSLEFCYDKLVLATGSISRKLEQIPAGLKNVYNLKNVEDLINILDLINNNSAKNVVIIGAGYIGLEATEALHNRGISVTILEKFQYPLPSTETDIQHLTFALLKHKGVSFYGNTDEIKITTKADYLRSINLDSRLLEFDIVLNAAGSVPNTELAKNCGLEIGAKGGIKVDSRLRTSCQDIYAAGDCIEVTNAITNRPDYFPLATLAHDFGHIAGENAAGGNKRIEPVVKNMSVKIFDKFLVNVGLNSDEAKKEKYLFNSVQEVVPNLIKVMPESDKVFGKIIYEKEGKKILGATFFGGREVSGYGDLISAFIKTKQSTDVLASVNFNYTPPLSPMINLLSMLGRKII
jgi:NADPH-dependent 2,4-dienoyl-CoA reductase/sulfur reductase-like enzyme